jgi:hypothetical protein
MFYNIKNLVYLLLSVSLTTGLREKRVGFDPRPVNVGFVVEKAVLDQVFIPVLLFPKSLSFHQYSVLIFHSLTTDSN